MMCRNCYGRGEIIYYDSFLDREISYACNECHWNGLEKNTNNDTKPLNAIELALKTLQEMKLKETTNALRKGKR